jgi:hypothetical protein
MGCAGLAAFFVLPCWSEYLFSCGAVALPRGIQCRMRHILHCNAFGVIPRGRCGQGVDWCGWIRGGIVWWIPGVGYSSSESDLKPICFLGFSCSLMNCFR